MGVTGVFSARADGATTVALGLAAVLARDSRTLLLDLHHDSAEIAPLLDIETTAGIAQVAYNAQLAPVDADELEKHVAWRDGIAVLAGVRVPRLAERVTDHFLTGLLDAARHRFEEIVIDLGRVRGAGFPLALANARLLWVVRPTPLGMEALERWRGELSEGERQWLAKTAVVLNGVNALSLAGADRYVQEEHDLGVAGSIPDTPEYWARVQIQHSVRALNTADPEHPRYRKAHGEEAAIAREAFEALAASLASAPVPELSLVR